MLRRRWIPIVFVSFNCNCYGVESTVSRMPYLPRKFERMDFPLWIRIHSNLYQQARHLKCDETHPVCLRCRRARIECRGYPSLDSFIDESQRVRERAESLSRSRTGPTPAAGQSHVSGQARAGRSFGNSLPAELSLIAFKDSIVLTHLLDRLFLDPQEAHDTGIGYKPWMINAVSENHAHTSAILALALVFFAKMHGQRDLIHQGAQFYGEALAQLRIDLLGKHRWSDRALSTSVIITRVLILVYLTHYRTMILSLYEVRIM